MNKVQELNFELMRLASFNDYDGEKVVSDLKAHTDLWSGAIMTRLESLIQLRDITNDYWNIDTLFILPRHGKEDELFALAKDWNADSIYWMRGYEAINLLGMYTKELEANPKAILRLWWD